MLKAIVDFIVPGSPARSTMCPSGMPPSIISSKPWMNVRMRCPWPIVTHSMLDGARITVPRPLSAREGVRLQEKAKKKGGVIANSHATAGRAYDDFCTRSVSNASAGNVYLLSGLLPGRSGGSAGVCPWEEPQGPRGRVPSRAGAVDQRPDEAVEAGRLQLPSVVRHGIPEGTRRRRDPPRERHPAFEGLQHLRASGPEPVRTRRGPLSGGDGGRVGSSAPRGRRPPEAVSAPHLLERTARMRIRGGGRRAARPARGTRRGPPGPGQARSAAANERARVRDPRAAQRNPGRDSVRPDRQAVRDGGARPGDETDEAHGAVKGSWAMGVDAQPRRGVPGPLPRPRPPASVGSPR